MKKRMISLFLCALAIFSVCCGSFCVNAAEDDAYSDVAVTDWYFQSVTFCREMGLMKGVGPGEFAPSGSINRAMFVTILHRLAGTPDAAPSGFRDVPPDSYYADAVAWAAENGIVSGTGENTFSPERSIIRQDMACMLARYLIHMDADFLRGDACEQAFLDIGLVSDYARNSVEIMRRTGLFRGDEASCFRPLDTANRTEAATLFTRVALALKIIPRQAILETGGKSYTISVEDTIWLYTILTGLQWQEGMYAEFVPTHTLSLWNGEYGFYLLDLPEGEFFDGINYVCGDSYMGSDPVDPLRMQHIYELLEGYTG